MRRWPGCIAIVDDLQERQANMHLTLADAIRKGASETLMCRRDYLRVRFSSTTHKPQHETCALGAAAVGAGLTPLTADDIERFLLARYPELDSVQAQCPLCRFKRELYSVIGHLNDTHDVSRELIAEWIDRQTLTLTPVAVMQAAR